MDNPSYSTHTQPAQPDPYSPNLGRGPGFAVSADIRPFRSPVTIARAVYGCLGLLIVTTVVSIVSTSNELGMLSQLADGVEVPLAEVQSTVDRQVMILWINLLAYVLTVVAFLFWIHRASANLASLGAVGQSAGPLAAILWWFVPVAYIFMPYIVVKEIWRGSTPPPYPFGEQDWKALPGSSLLPWWWVIWLVSESAYLATVQWVMASNLTLRIDAIRFADQWYLLAHVLNILAASLCFMVVWRITRHQGRKAAFTEPTA